VYSESRAAYPAHSEGGVPHTKPVGGWVGVRRSTFTFRANLEAGAAEIASFQFQPGPRWRGKPQRDGGHTANRPRGQTRYRGRPLSPCPASTNRLRLLQILQSCYGISHLKGISGHLLSHPPPPPSPLAPHSTIPGARPAMAPQFEEGTRAGKPHTMQSGWPSKSPRNPPTYSFH
jgi:hypothetical protein